MLNFLKMSLMTLCLGLLLGSCTTAYMSKYTQSRASASSTQGNLKDQNRIIPLDKKTFRFHQRFAAVWNSTLDILLDNYNLTIVDRRSGIITTEWDTFYLNEKVYRNKVSIRLKKRAFNIVDVTVHNSIETWKSIDGSHQQLAWLPADQGNKEVSRIIKNLAISMNLPQPTLPVDNVASRRSNKLQQ